MASRLLSPDDARRTLVVPLAHHFFDILRALSISTRTISRFGENQKPF